MNFHTNCGQLLTTVLKADAHTGFRFHQREIPHEPCKHPTMARGMFLPATLRSDTLRFPCS